MEISNENLNDPDIKREFIRRIKQFVSMFLQKNNASEYEVKNEIKTMKKEIKSITKKQKGKDFFDAVDDEHKKNELIFTKNQLETIRKLGRARDSPIFSINSDTSYRSSVSSFASDESDRSNSLDLPSSNSGRASSKKRHSPTLGGNNYTRKNKKKIYLRNKFKAP